MDAHKKQILARYGALRHALANNPLGNPNLEQLKLDVAKVKFDMEMNDLTEKDFANYRKKSNQTAQSKRATENRVATNKALQKGILFIVAGVAAIVLGIGLRDAMNGGLVFYGLVFFGIFLLVKGGMELYAYRALK